MDIRTKALEAYKARKAAQAEEERRRLAELAEKAVKQVRERLGVEAKADPEGGVAIVDGLRFSTNPAGYNLKMEQACSRCGAGEWVEVGSLADVGAFLSGDREVICLKCIGSNLKPERTLVDILDVIAERLTEIRDALDIFWK